MASSLDALPPASVPYDMRGRWLRALRQTTRAVHLVEERLVAGPEAEGPWEPGAGYMTLPPSLRQRADQVIE